MIGRLRRLVFRAIFGDLDAMLAIVDSPEFTEAIEEQAITLRVAP